VTVLDNVKIIPTAQVGFLLVCCLPNEKDPHNLHFGGQWFLWRANQGWIPIKDDFFDPCGMLESHVEEDLQLVPYFDHQGIEIFDRANFGLQMLPHFAHFGPRVTEVRCTFHRHKEDEVPRTALFVLIFQEVPGSGAGMPTGFVD
jgi:hypothetical protein